ncbi:MAG TPA: hypothetical protein VEX57_09515, partial [Microlunatus sp.]|nr:hypothetical protein [Microlunatus sp.]
GGLARVDVGHDPDVADMGQVGLDVDSHGVASTSPQWICAGDLLGRAIGMRSPGGSATYQR